MTLLTTTEYRAFTTTSLEDAALQLLLDAAETEIDNAAGPLGSVTEYFGGGGRFICLARKPGSITSVTETYGSTDTVIATDDYLIDGYILERLTGGTNSRSRWSWRVKVIYAPVDDTDLRESVQVDLVNLALNYAPGSTSETIGAWTEQLASNAVWNNSLERASILSRLAPDPYMAVVGQR